MSRTSREAESRSHEMIEEYNMDYTSPFDIPPGVAKPGYSYIWANTDIRGTPTHRVEDLRRKLWVVVPPERFPNYMGDPLGRNALADRAVVYKDTILMERPERYLEMEQQRDVQKANNQIRSLRGVTNDSPHH